MNEGTDPTRTVRTDGITVRKTIEADGNVRLEIDSELEREATVRIADPTLESHPNEDVQFHTDHVADWILDDAPVFERGFDPEEQQTVRYRIPDAERDTLDAEPEVSVIVDRELDGIVDRSRSDALRELVSGERDSLSSEPAAEEPKDAADHHPTVEEDAIDAVPSGGVARVLLAELRNGDIDEETASALRDELGRQEKRSLDVRLTHLQSEVGDLAAYTDTIESFIDRHGTFDSVVGEVRSDLSALQTRTERVDSAIEELSETVDGLDDGVEDVRSVQSELESELDEVRVLQSEFESNFEELDEELSNVHDRLDELERFEERLSGVFRDLRGGESDG